MGSGAGHSHLLYRHGHTPVHALAPQVKIVAALSFMLLVVATPSTQRWAFGAYAVLLAGVASIARVPPGFLIKRSVVELPFVVAALLMPVFALGPRVDVLGLSLSASGLESGFNLLVKATLGVFTSLLLAATTDLRAVLSGLQRLRVPALLVEIMAFMLRYVEVVGAEMGRMRVARESRCFEARRGERLRSLRITAAATGALFIRAYERGERVHLAMLSRGYSGGLPVLDVGRATTTQWAAAAALPTLALVVASAAWLGNR